MKTNQHLMKFRQKCLSKLSRTDAEFFLDQSTLKDMAICGTLIDLKKITFEDDYAFDRWTARYLQIMMVLSSVSDDPRDENLVNKFMNVPFECEEIIKNRKPYKNPDVFFLICDKIRGQHPLHLYWHYGGLDTEYLLSRTPKNKLPMVNQILSYYSTPIVGIVALMNTKVSDFHFLDELKLLLGHILSKHYAKKTSFKPEEFKYIEAMKFILDLKMRKAS